MSKHYITLWFVKCPEDPEGTWQPALHPLIHHVCRFCNYWLSYSKPNKDHVIRKLQLSANSGKALLDLQEKVRENPKLFVKE